MLIRKSILFINVISLIVEVGLIFTDPYILLVCKAIQGFCIGNYMGMVPVYIKRDRRGSGRRYRGSHAWGR